MSESYVEIQSTSPLGEEKETKEVKSEKDLSSSPPRGFSSVFIPDTRIYADLLRVIKDWNNGKISECSPYSRRDECLLAVTYTSQFLYKYELEQLERCSSTIGGKTEEFNLLDLLSKDFVTSLNLPAHSDGTQEFVTHLYRSDSNDRKVYIEDEGFTTLGEYRNYILGKCNIKKSTQYVDLNSTSSKDSSGTSLSETTSHSMTSSLSSSKVQDNLLSLNIYEIKDRPEAFKMEFLIPRSLLLSCGDTSFYLTEEDCDKLGKLTSKLLTMLVLYITTRAFPDQCNKLLLSK